MELITTPLFWCLKVADQAKLIEVYWNLCGKKLDVPSPPHQSKAAWQAAWDGEEVDEELERIMRLPSHSHKLEER